MVSNVFVLKRKMIREACAVGTHMSLSTKTRPVRTERDVCESVRKKGREWERKEREDVRERVRWV